jgi:hypothetical protein
MESVNADMVAGTGITDFGWALQALKAGMKVYRLAWNAPGQYVVLQRGRPEGAPVDEETSSTTGLPLGTIVVFRAFFMIHLADNTFASWVPSVTDCLADDWMVKPKEQL